MLDSSQSNHVSPEPLVLPVQAQPAERDKELGGWEWVAGLSEMYVVGTRISSSLNT